MFPSQSKFTYWSVISDATTEFKQSIMYRGQKKKFMEWVFMFACWESGIILNITIHSNLTINECGDALVLAVCFSTQ